MDDSGRKPFYALVTGGAGFIGSNVVRLLLDKGCSVRVVDDLSTGHLVNLKGLGAEFLHGSILDSALMEGACRGVDVVFHLAACVGRQRSIDAPAVDSTANLVGTVQVLEAMRKNKVPRIVYSSSAAIFGELTGGMIGEDHPQNADSPYGVSKLAAEKMVLAYNGLYGITGICLRYFNIYGKNQRFDPYGNVIPIFAMRIRNGEPIIIYGDGNQTRDFVNVRDVALANYLGAISCEGTNVYNLGSGTRVTIDDLAVRMQKISNRSSNIQYAPRRPGDVLHCLADMEKSGRMLGFSAAIDLDTGLREYMDWFAAQADE